MTLLVCSLNQCTFVILSFSKKLSMNVRENVVLKRTVVGSDCCFSTICAVVTFRVKVCIMSVDCTLYST